MTRNNDEQKKIECEARYWAKQHRAKKIERKKLEEIVKKRGDLFRRLLNQELGMKKMSEEGYRD